MDNQDYAVAFTVNQSPEAVFDAINDVRGWWSQAVRGETDRLGAVFYHHYKDVHRCTLEITEFAPGKRVVWRVLHNDFDFIEDRTEWNGSDIVFDIVAKGDRTEVRFTHRGLAPAWECFDLCSNAWGHYVTGSLRKRIATGKGEPNPVDEHAGHQDEVVAKVRAMNRNLRDRRDARETA
jgi:hypothetical protein